MTGQWLSDPAILGEVFGSLASSVIPAALDTAALAFTAGFAGFALHNSLVDVPAILEMSGPAMMLFFSGFYQRLRPRQTWNIVLGSLASILRISVFANATPMTLICAHTINASVLWLIFTYTCFTMVSGNTELINMARKPSEFNQQRCRQLIHQWREKHTARTLLSCIAALVLAFSVSLTAASCHEQPPDPEQVQFYEQAL